MPGLSSRGGCTPGNSRLGQLAAARAHREDSARARKKPSGASVKVFGQAFFKKLAGCGAEPYDLALIGAQRMRKS